MTPPVGRPLRVGFLGPPGTFAEQALLTQPDLAAAELVPLAAIGDVLAATDAGTVDLGFIPIENSIEGTVTFSLDALAFTHHLLIQREVVLDVELCLLAPAGTELRDVREVVSFPHALAQCRQFFEQELPGVVTTAALSTAGAAQTVGEAARPGVAAIGTSLAGKLYGLEAIASHVEDHDLNQTRFLLVGGDDVPAPTGHDKTSITVYQRADVPGSLLGILQEFAARQINLTKVESRPTKKGGLGDYCFVIDLEGHVADEVVTDCLRELHMKQGGIKFLGSYPAAGAHASALRRDADAAWQEADTWVRDLRGRVGDSTTGPPTP